MYIHATFSLVNSNQGEVERVAKDIDLEIIAKEMKGNTLIIYWFMLRTNEPHSAREIQRRTGVSSSSLALHHLNKLIDLGLVAKDQHGEYLIARKVSPGLLSFFLGTGSAFIPRFVFYAVFSTGLLLSSLYMFLSHLTTASIILVASLAIFSFIFWFESLRVWRIQPV
jgi:hypothetical protein